MTTPAHHLEHPMIRTRIAAALNRLAYRIAPTPLGHAKAAWMDDAMTARDRWRAAPPAWTGLQPDAELTGEVPPHLLDLQRCVNATHARMNRAQATGALPWTAAAGDLPDGHLAYGKPLPPRYVSLSDARRDTAVGALASLEDLAVDAAPMFSAVEDVRRLAQTVRDAL